MTRALLLFTAVVLICSAHVGSPDVWYDGPAGPYSVRVLVQPPQVVPGLARISVRVRGGADRVLVAPARFDTGAEGAPTPDIAQRDVNDWELFNGQLWLMTRGAYRIVVTVQGARGRGTAIVPVTAAASERLGMSAPLAIALSAMALFLLVGLVTIVGAGVREGVLPAGEQPKAPQMRRARVAMTVSSIVVALLVVGAWRWVSEVDGFHRSQLDRPWQSEAHVRFTDNGTPVLRFTITDSLWLALRKQGWRMPNARFQRASLIADHGKLMHMFLVRKDDLAAFAHVHPTTQDTVTFVALLPPLPGGTYSLFADIVDASGAARTLTTTVNIPPGIPASAAVQDSDDAYWTGPPASTLNAQQQSLGSGLTLNWLTPAQFAAGQEVEIAFTVTDQHGNPAALQPYLGMVAHAVVQHEQGDVFIHLHPLGTISTAAQEVLGASVGVSNTHATHFSAAERVVFPYAFPKPGYYRVWIQIKHAGRILTVARDLPVIRPGEASR